MKKTVKTVSPSVTTNPVAPAPTPTPPAPPTVVTTMSDAAVTECGALLDQVLALVGAQDPLDASEVRRSTKMRKGGAEVIPKIIALCQQHGVTQIGALSTDEMSKELSRGDALVQVGVRSSLVQKKVKNAAMGAHGRSWQIATTMYTTLKRMAVDDPELALGIAPVSSFFQTKRTKGKVRQNRRVSAQKELEKKAGVTTAPAGTTTPGAPEPSPPVVPPTANGTSNAPVPTTANGSSGAASPAVVNGAGH